jgi:ABC-type sugar transport system ATPase subunit
MSRPFLSAAHLSKAYEGVVAVSDVSFDVQPGEIIGLVGKNGAGKSTVIKMLAGAAKPDAGSFVIDGNDVDLASPHAALAQGFAFVHQELEQIPNVSVAENVMLGSRLPRRASGLVSWRQTNRVADEVLRRLDPSIRSKRSMVELSVAQKHLVLIARALYREARLLVLDEPSTSLTVHEIDRLHAICRQIRETGGSIIYVSHRLDEILSLSDRVMVMRDGALVSTSPTADLTHAQLVTEITGARSVSDSETRHVNPRQDADRQAPRLAVRDLTGPGIRAPISFEVAAGEVLGIAGLVGAGRTELLELIFGAVHPTGGTVELDGSPRRMRNPRSAMRAGLALIPEDRRHQGLIMDFGIRANITLASLDKVKSFVPAFPSKAKESRVTDGLIDSLQISTVSREKEVRLLSGGNQQKVVVGKWLARDSKVLMFDEPTAGIDVGAKEQIYELIERLAAEGRAIIFVSSEFGELTAVCHRVMVLREGELVGQLTGEEIEEPRIVSMCYLESGARPTVNGATA